MGKRYPKEIREEVLGKVRSGNKVAAVVREHGINEMTIRNCFALPLLLSFLSSGTTSHALR